MPQRNELSRTSVIAIHSRAQELRCSTNVMSMSPASNVNLTARNSSKVQPFPPQPPVMASFHTAATFSRSDASLIFIKLGKSSAISLTPYFIDSPLIHQWTGIAESCWPKKKSSHLIGCATEALKDFDHEEDKARVDAARLIWNNRTFPATNLQFVPVWIFKKASIIAATVGATDLRAFEASPADLAHEPGETIHFFTGLSPKRESRSVGLMASILREAEKRF